MNHTALPLLLAAAALAGCASPGPPPSALGRAGPPAARPLRPAVFISPMGQVFRSGLGQPYPSAQWFAAADADKDGRLNRAEFIADAMAFFHQLDLNHDGLIDSPENQAYEALISPEALGGGRGGGRLAGQGGPEAGERRGPPGGGRGPGGGRRGGRGGAGPGGGGDLREELLGAARYGLLLNPQPVRSADADQSQSVSEAEFKAAAGRRFDKLDTDADGVIAYPDLPMTPAQAIQARQAAAASARRPR